MATVLRPNAAPEQATPANGRQWTLPELQALVGGFIEAIRVPPDGWMFVNEDGIQLGLPDNPQATERLLGTGVLVAGAIRGTAVICDPGEVA